MEEYIMLEIVEYECSACGVTKPEAYRLRDHVEGKRDDAHDADDPDSLITEREPDVPDVSETTLEAIYNLNKHAKQYAELADKNYRNGKGATAKRNSCKKTALYSLKSKILDRILPAVSRIECHKINGTDFYCLYFEDWSFHTPVEDLDVPDEQIGSTESLKEFEKDGEKTRSDMSLKASLLHIRERFGLSANDELPQNRVSYGNQSYFIGWKYL